MAETIPLPPPPEDGKYRVLVMEDDPFIGRLILTNLVKANLECRVATDGIDGLVEFKSYYPHLVISDIMMPGMDGRKVCATIREMSAIPIILITAADTSEAELIAFKSGADDFVPKPFDPRLLTARAVAALRRVYRYDVDAYQQADRRGAAAPAEAGDGTNQWMTCQNCAYRGPVTKFKHENARGERYMMCPHCQEVERFTYVTRS